MTTPTPDATKIACVAKTPGNGMYLSPMFERADQTVIPVVPTNKDVTNRWADGIVTYSLENHTGDIPDGHMQELAAGYGLEIWRLRIDKIKFKRVKPGQPCDIPITFSKSDPYFTSPSTMAYTWYPNPQNPLGGHVVINDDPKLLWSIDGKPIPMWVADPVHYAPGSTDLMAATYNLAETLAHELGHALGFPHQDNCTKCIMYPYYHNDLQLQPPEIELAQTVYGKRDIDPRIIEQFENHIITRV